VFANDVTDRLQKIRDMARRDAKQQPQAGESVEQVQLYPLGENSSIRIQVPPAESEDQEGERRRAVFEAFAPEMRAALESGSLDQLNKVLAGMDILEAEKMVGLLSEVRLFLL
jgi:cell division cycle protein 37